MKRDVGRIVVTLLALTLGVAAADVQELLATGDRHRAKFDNLKAFECYEEAHELEPKNVEALLRLTQAYNDVGEDLDSKESERYFELAVEHAEELRSSAPDRAQTFYLLSISYGNLALFRGGRAKVRLSRTLEADARRAVELDPEYATPYAVLGAYYREVAILPWLLRALAEHVLGGLPSGSLEASERMCFKALECNPASVYAHFQLALTYKAMEREREAVDYFEKVRQLPMTDHRDHWLRQEALGHLEKLGRK